MTAVPPPDVPDSRSTVLLIEDDADTRDMYALAFAQHGFRAMAAASTAEGLTAAQALKPDVIVTDVGLPGRTNVFDMMRQLRVDRQTRHIPVIAVTGYELPAGPQTARFECVLLKPVPPDLLVDSVRTVLEHSALLRQRARRLRAAIPEMLDRSQRVLERSAQVSREHAAKRRRR